MSETLEFMQPFCCYCQSLTHNFRENCLDNTSAIVCPVLLNTQCQRCFTKGHTTTSCKMTYEDEESCSYCHKFGHIKKHCPVLGSKQCSYCKDMGHVVSRCFKLKTVNSIK